MEEEGGKHRQGTTCTMGIKIVTITAVSINNRGKSGRATLLTLLPILSSRRMTVAANMANVKVTAKVKVNMDMDMMMTTVQVRPPMILVPSLIHARAGGDMGGGKGPLLLRFPVRCGGVRGSDARGGTKGGTKSGGRTVCPR